MIGVFDSGLGGLTILKELRKTLPQYDYLYLGDTLHLPYGNRSQEAIYQLTVKACDFLFAQGVKLIIIACNTASAKALPRLQQEYLLQRKSKTENILGVVRPVAEYFAQHYQRIGVIGTRGTIDSLVYEKEIKQLNKKAKIYQVATPLLVPLIEEGWGNSPEMEGVLRKYLKVLKSKKLEGLILGCTHYPLVIRQIQKQLGQNCVIPHPGKIVSWKLQEYLKRHLELEKTISRQGKCQYCVTDLTDNFREIAQKFLKNKIIINQVEY